ncbi:protein FAM210B, mitochondrial isoform X2 [Pelodiscus sinensis]|uniref:protein FAM210B, mitochondrial isoform X2 n=1 Tax=Pelodiscus sinensis TaxID=13735 RepID=UPI003F6B399B
MPWLVHLGPPGAGRWLGSEALLQATVRIAWSKVGSGCRSPRAAAGALPSPGGQVRAGGKAPRRRQQRPSLLQGSSWLLLAERRNPLRLLPAAALLVPADPGSRAGCSATEAGYLPPRQSVGYKQQVQEDAACSHLQPQISLQATASNFPGSGSGKDTSRSPGKEITDPSDEDEKKPNKSQQLKKVFKEYGAVGVSFHIGISLMSLGIFYLAVSRY